MTPARFFCGGGLEGEVGIRRLADEKHRTTWGEADFGGAEGEGAFCEADDLVCWHAAVGEADAESESVAG